MKALDIPETVVIMRVKAAIIRVTAAITRVKAAIIRVTVAITRVKAAIIRVTAAIRISDARSIVVTHGVITGRSEPLAYARGWERERGQRRRCAWPNPQLPFATPASLPSLR